MPPRVEKELVSAVAFLVAWVGYTTNMFSLYFPMFTYPGGSLSFNSSSFGWLFIVLGILTMIALWREWRRAARWISGGWAAVTLFLFYANTMAVQQGMGREMGWGWVPFGIGTAMMIGGAWTWAAIEI